MYGRTFTLSDAAHHELGDKVSGAGQARQYTREKGFLAYYEVSTHINEIYCKVLQYTLEK